MSFELYWEQNEKIERKFNAIKNFMKQRKVNVLDMGVINERIVNIELIDYNSDWKQNEIKIILENDNYCIHDYTLLKIDRKYKLIEFDIHKFYNIK